LIKKGKKNLVIYGEKNSVLLRTYYKILPSKFKLIEVAPTKIHFLEGLQNFVNVKNLMKLENKIIRDIATVEYLKEEIPFLNELNNIQNLNYFTEDLDTVVYELQNHVNITETRYSKNSEEVEALFKEIYELAKKENYFNEEIKGLYLKHKKKLHKLKFILNFAVGRYTYSIETKIPDKQRNLIVYTIIKDKMFIPNKYAIKNLKQETIYKKL